MSIRSDGSSDSSESYVMISQAAMAARETLDNALFNIQTGQAAAPPSSAPSATSARAPSPALEYALEVTEDMDNDDAGSGSGRLTPRPVDSERPASIHEPEVVVKRKRTVLMYHFLFPFMLLYCINLFLSV